MNNQQTKNVDISIIIVSWNTAKLTRDCLESVYQQIEDVRIEVVVVDNASTDGSAAMIKTEFPKVKLIENKTNRGFAAANNQGMKIADGRYILLLNSDTKVLDNAIYKTVEFADSHPEAAVIGCRVLNSDRSLQPTCFMFPSLLNLFLAATYLYKIFPKNKFFGSERMSWWQRDDTREVDVVTGCFMLVRKEAIEQIGLMDESFFMYGEETDWCYRFKNAGWENLFTPEAQIIHYSGQSSKMVRGKMIVQLRCSILNFMEKHHSKSYYAFSCVFVWLFFLVRIPFWFIKWLLVKHNRQSSRQQLKMYVTAAFRMLTGGGDNLCIKQ